MTDHVVYITDAAFVPKIIDVLSGDMVIWENRTGVSHSATRSQAPSFDTGPIGRGESSAGVPFSTLGELVYQTSGTGAFEGLIRVGGVSMTPSAAASKPTANARTKAAKARGPRKPG
jgi:plastocyanin